MDINQLIDDLKFAQNLQFQACVKLIRENQRKQNEDIQFLVQTLSEDLESYTKSLDEIGNWYEQEREKAYSQALAKVHPFIPCIQKIQVKHSAYIHATKTKKLVNGK